MLDLLDFLRRIFRRHSAAVSKALNVEPGALEQAFLNAIGVIDRVHSDGTLPTLPVKHALLLDMYGYFQNTTDGDAVEIVVSTLNPHIELTTAHEIGHFLDFMALDRSGEWASVSSLSLARWREAVKKSQAVQMLGRLMDPAIHSIEVAIGDNSMVEHPVDKKYVGYLLQAEELWARSYAQFIAARSRTPELLLQLGQEQERPVSGIFYEKQWSDTDFQPIMAEIEAVFRRLRWMR